MQKKLIGLGVLLMGTLSIMSLRTQPIEEAPAEKTYTQYCASCHGEIGRAHV